MKPVQLKDNSVSDAIDTPRTTGVKDSHKERGICWPNTNWEAEALKNGSKAFIVCVKDTATAANDTLDMT
jgi:hypothetical protein